MAAARAAGFDNINLDFIYGLPDQPPATWRRTLEQAVDLAPEHISLYSLTIEEGTPFGEWAAAGRLAQPSPDLAADLYELADEVLAVRGLCPVRDQQLGERVRARPHNTNLPIYQSPIPASPAATT